MSWLSVRNDDVQEQRSQAWFAFRKRHIGASQVPAIMGTCDFRTAKDIWNDKLDIEQSEPDNFAMQRGRSLEPIIISIFEERYNCKLSSPTIEYKEYTTLSASLDGYWRDENAVVEVKAPSRIKHIQALCGIVPDTYADQLQAEMLVSGASMCYYVSYHPDEPDALSFAVVEVLPDKKRQDEILERCKLFWDMVEKGEWNENF